MVHQLPAPPYPAPLHERPFPLRHLDHRLLCRRRRCMRPRRRIDCHRLQVGLLRPRCMRTFLHLVCIILHPS